MGVSLSPGVPRPYHLLAAGRVDNHGPDNGWSFSIKDTRTRHQSNILLLFPESLLRGTNRCPLAEKF
jgi:hypothetical protein